MLRPIAIFLGGCLGFSAACGSLTGEISRIESSATALAHPGGSGSSGSSGGTAVTAAATPAAAVWARTVATGPTDSSLNAVAVDAGGNIYAAGSQFGTGTYTFGAQSTNGPFAGNNATLVKYDAGGTVQWARTVSAAAGSSVFRSVATDSAGNIYAAGFQNNSSSFTYSGQIATGNCAGNNLVVVKYDSTGTAAWARTVGSCGSAAQANAVATDAAGNVYAAGYQVGTATYGYNGQTATGTSTFTNVVLVKYNISGTTQWARSLAAGTGNAQFNAVAVDTSGNIYGAGYQSGTGTYTYGGQSAIASASGTNSVLVKYDSAGTALWARTLSAGSSPSQYLGVFTDAGGNIFAVGYQTGTGTFTYGSRSITGSSAGTNVTLVKYDSSGTVLAATTLAAGTGNSQFNSVRADSLGNVYAAGFQEGTGTYSFGAVSATGTATGNNSILVRYSPALVAQWANTLAVGTSAAAFNGIALDAANNIYAGGTQTGTGTYTYGAQSIAAPYTGSNIALIKYQ